MKLLAQTTKYYSIAFAVILLIHVIISYFSITYFVHLRLEKALRKELRIIEKVFTQTDSTPDLRNFGENELTYAKVDAVGEMEDQFQTISLYSKREEEWLDYYELTTHIKAQDSIFQINIRRSLGWTNELIASLVFSSVLAIVLLFVGLLFLNRRINRKVWEPFYHTLKRLNEFELRSGKDMKLNETQIEEFDQLNQELQLLTDKLQQDYQGQKHFVENASHELQTPLAIITTQLELILQSDRLQETEIQLVASALDATDRLSRINKSLITLSRIENLQYPDTTVIDLKKIIESNLKIYTRESQSKHVQIHYNPSDSCQLNMNESLAHMIIRNLIQNAIRHNVENGEVWISFTADSFLIRNSGLPTQIDPDKLFGRFYTQSDSEGSIGLGLAIVKQICELYGFPIDYQIKDNMHIILISFATNLKKD